MAVGQLAGQATASASIVCQIVCGKLFMNLKELRVLTERLSEDDVIVLLKGLPEGKEDMARTAVEALRRAAGRA